MPAGTWNLGRLRKQVEYKGIKDLDTLVVRDTSLTSEDYFNITDWPNSFTAGKNLFKIRSNNDNLVRDSQIYVEILDFNGNPIYNEPLNYVEHDGTRVISVYIYENTSPGLCTVYVAARARQNAQSGQKYRFSKDVKDQDYYNIPNVIWSRRINVSPENSQNKSEIIYVNQPVATINEVVQPYLQPINLADVAVEKSGSGTQTMTITPIPSATPPPYQASGIPQAVPQGSARGNSPRSSYGQQQLATPIIQRGDAGSVVTATSQPYNTVGSYSLLTTSGFPLSASMEGGTIIVVNPIVETQDQTFINAQGQALPSSQFDNNLSTTEVDPSNPITSGITQIPLSGSYIFGISNVLTSTKARVYQLSGFRNVIDNTLGGFNAKLISTQTLGAALASAALGGPGAGGGFYPVNTIESSTNFTASFIEPFVTQTTQQSQSFAEIVLSNTDPATGDVHHIKTQYKPGGQFGDFIDGGTTIVEQTEILEDTGSFETTPQIGAVYNKVGFFTSLGDFETYWTASGGPLMPEVEIVPSFHPDELMSGVQLTPDTAFDNSNTGTNRFGFIHITSSYLPTLAVNTDYIFTMNATANNNFANTDTNIPFPRIDIYISSSQGAIDPDPDYIGLHRQTTINVDDTLADNFADDKLFGKRISTVEFTPSASLFPIESRFTALKNERADVYIVVRSGQWTIANISIKTLKQTGFTPNYVRLFNRVPTEFLDTPLTFKFNYFDFQGNEAEVETIVYPVTFTGDNMFVGGTSNLLSGSLFVGSVIGSGVELAGVSSAFIRSVGYLGFTSGTLAGALPNADISVQPFGDGETFDVTSAQSGFMLFSGSILGDITDDYTLGGIGMDIVAHSSSYIRYRTRHDSTGDGAADTSLLEIKTDAFFLGSDASFVCGSGDGTIAISSSAFELSTEGSVIMEGTLTIETGANIAGWEIMDQAITSSNEAGHGIILSSSGDIQTRDFQSALFGATGKGYRLGKDGIAEFDEVRVRGTLSTAVFEKEKVSAVGGALIVANATAISSGSTVLSSSCAIGYVNAGHHPTSSLIVDSAAGFVSGEIIMAKTVDDNGFVEELMKIHSVDSGNNILLVSRSVNQTELIHTHLTPTMSAGQTIVSLGKQDTGFILLNATSGSETPYIDIVERTGSVYTSDGGSNNTITDTGGYSEGVKALDIKARLGDLSGISDTINGQSVTGYGLYTDNAFLKGGIVATYGKIGGFSITEDAISGVPYNASTTQFFISGAASTVNNALATPSMRMVISSSFFNVKSNGELTASAIQATFGQLGAFELTNDAFIGKTTLEGNLVPTQTLFISASAQINTGTLREQMFISSSDFNVKASGQVTSSGLLVVSGSGLQRRVLFDHSVGGKVDGLNNGRTLGVRTGVRGGISPGTGGWVDLFIGDDWAYCTQATGNENANASNLIGPFMMNPLDEYIVVFYTLTKKCFTKDTLITMADGISKKQISDLKEGDIVKSEKGTSKVTQIRKHEEPTIVYSINNGKGFVTDTHQLKTTKGFKTIGQSKKGQLQIGDELITLSGTEIVTSINEEKEVSVVYNISTDNEHVYYANEYLVHNKMAIPLEEFMVGCELNVMPGDMGEITPNEFFDEDFYEKRFFQAIQPTGDTPFSEKKDNLGTAFDPPAAYTEPFFNVNGTSTTDGMSLYPIGGDNCNGSYQYPHFPGVIVIRNGACDLYGQTLDFRNRLVVIRMMTKRQPGTCDAMENTAYDDDFRLEIGHLLGYTCNQAQLDKLIGTLGEQSVVSPYDYRDLIIHGGKEVSSCDPISNSCGGEIVTIETDCSANIPDEVLPADSDDSDGGIDPFTPDREGG